VKSGGGNPFVREIDHLTGTRYEKIFLGRSI
jgi:hypothetical protein